MFNYKKKIKNLISLYNFEIIKSGKKNLNYDFTSFGYETKLRNKHCVVFSTIYTHRAKLLVNTQTIPGQQ